jgi:SAM-dependent methyltransferase
MRKRVEAAIRRMCRMATKFESRFDHEYLHGDVPLSKTIAFGIWQVELLATFNRPGTRVLEIGSREVTGQSPFRQALGKVEYVGFDYYGGPNVDVVGDAHRLSSYFPPGERFDLICSSAVFEHLAMPWIVAIEIAKMLRVGGHVFIETHFSYSSHERPWHFFQFSDQALRVLFNSALGFSVLEAGLSNPLVGRFSSLAHPGLRGQRVSGLYCHAELLARKVQEVADFRWEGCDLAVILRNSEYPAPAVSA